MPYDHRSVHVILQSGRTSDLLSPSGRGQQIEQLQGKNNFQWWHVYKYFHVDFEGTCHCRVQLDHLSGQS